MLRRRHPPEASLSALDQQALKELIQELMTALTKGETSLSIEASQREVLERSGWLAAAQVMVVEDDQLHWKRMHQAIQHLELELIDRSHLQPARSRKRGESF